MSHTCPLSRCRLPLVTREELAQHVEAAARRADDSIHNVAAMSPAELAQEVTHLVAANLRLELSCAYHKEVADSWRAARSVAP